MLLIMKKCLYEVSLNYSCTFERFFKDKLR